MSATDGEEEDFYLAETGTYSGVPYAVYPLKCERYVHFPDQVNHRTRISQLIRSEAELAEEQAYWDGYEYALYMYELGCDTDAEYPTESESESESRSEAADTDYFGNWEKFDVDESGLYSYDTVSEVSDSADLEDEDEGYDADIETFALDNDDQAWGPDKRTSSPSIPRQPRLTYHRR